MVSRDKKTDTKKTSASIQHNTIQYNKTQTQRPAVSYKHNYTMASTISTPTMMIIDDVVKVIGAIDFAALAQSIAFPLMIMFSLTLLVAYLYFVVILMNSDHTIISMLKMNFSKGLRPPVAPVGMLECIYNMTSDQQPWFPLRAQKALGGTDTFVLPLPRRPVMTGDYQLARQVLMDPLSIKPRVYQEFEPLGVGSIFTRNGSYWVSKMITRMCCNENWIERKSMTHQLFSHFQID